MTYNELVETLCDYFELEYPEIGYDGSYDILNAEDWNTGSKVGNSVVWITLANVVDALSCYIRFSE